MFDVPSASFVAEVIDRRTAPATSPEMITALADYWIVRGRPERAIPLYEESLKQGNLDDSRTLVFQNNLAMLYSQVLGKHAEALKIVDSALETRRDNIILLDTKGLIHINSGNPSEAVIPLQRAVELSCQLPIYCMHLAYALHLDGRPSQARRYFDPVRPQLNEASSGMRKENKAMFDALQLALPPIETQ
jgi:predicted Zn-dependent protease